MPEAQPRTGVISRRNALALLGAIVTARTAPAAEAGILRPVSLDHVNIRVTDVARSFAFYSGLFSTPVLRNAALRARPDLPPSEGYFLKFGEGYLAMSQAFAPDVPGLDHYSVGLADYDQARFAAKMKESGLSADARGVDIWAQDPDGFVIQLRPPGGWARQTATPYTVPARSGALLTPFAMSRIGLQSADTSRAAAYYARLFGAQTPSTAPGRSPAFSLGDAALELVSAPANAAASARPGMDHIRIAIKDFNAESVGRVLREKRITASEAQGALRIADPDGIGIELAAN